VVLQAVSHVVHGRQFDRRQPADERVRLRRHLAEVAKTPISSRSVVLEHRLKLTRAVANRLKVREKWAGTNLNTDETFRVAPCGRFPGVRLVVPARFARGDVVTATRRTSLLRLKTDAGEVGRHEFESWLRHPKAEGYQATPPARIFRKAVRSFNLSESRGRSGIDPNENRPRSPPHASKVPVAMRPAAGLNAASHRGQASSSGFPWLSPGEARLPEDSVPRCQRHVAPFRRRRGTRGR